VYAVARDCVQIAGSWLARALCAGVWRSPAFALEQDRAAIKRADIRCIDLEGR
jgi:hypothetical protein